MKAVQDRERQQQSQQRSIMQLMLLEPQPLPQSWPLWYLQQEQLARNKVFFI